MSASADPLMHHRTVAASPPPAVGPVWVSADDPSSAVAHSLRTREYAVQLAAARLAAAAAVGGAGTAGGGGGGGWGGLPSPVAKGKGPAHRRHTSSASGGGSGSSSGGVGGAFDVGNVDDVECVGGGLEAPTPSPPPPPSPPLTQTPPSDVSVGALCDSGALAATADGGGSLTALVHRAQPSTSVRPTPPPPSPALSDLDVLLLPDRTHLRHSFDGGPPGRIGRHQVTPDLEALGPQP